MRHLRLRHYLAKLHLTSPALGYRGYGWCHTHARSFDRPLIMRVPLSHRSCDVITSRDPTSLESSLLDEDTRTRLERIYRDRRIVE